MCCVHLLLICTFVGIVGTLVRGHCHLLVVFHGYRQLLLASTYLTTSWSSPWSPTSSGQLLDDYSDVKNPADHPVTTTGLRHVTSIDHHHVTLTEGRHVTSEDLRQIVLNAARLVTCVALLQVLIASDLAAALRSGSA